MYIILTDSRKKAGEKVALVDRTKYPDQWWTENIDKAMKFEKLEAANIQKSKLKFNNPEVWTLEKGKVRLGQVAVPRKGWLERALDRKQAEWHDDDWNEGTNTYPHSI